ncbi:MAG: ATP-binding protein [Balneolaceae bacterium]|nr:ATP-binding protein [Balneolaceae bacterium]
MQPSTVTSIAELSDILIAEAKYEEAKQWLILGYEVSEEIGYDQGKFSILTLLADQYLQQNQTDSALVMIEQANLLEKSVEQQEKLLELTGDANTQSGKYVLAVEQYKNAAALADSIGNARREAELTYKTARAWSALGDHTEALRAYYYGLEYAEKAGDSEFIAQASNSVGSEFLKILKYDQAEFFLLKAEEIARKIGLTNVLENTLLNLAVLYREESDFEKSESYYEEVLKLAEAGDNPVNHSLLYYHLGIMEKYRGNLSEAEHLLLLALELSRENNEIQRQYESATALGKLEMERGDVIQAIRYYARANNAIEGENLESLALTSYNNLYRAYRESGNFVESLRWLEQHDQLKDSLETAEKSRLLAEYETLFNLKQTREQAEVLRASEQRAQSMVTLQRWLIGLALLAGIILTFASIILVKSNKRRKKVNVELEKSNRQLQQMNKMVKEQNEELEQVNNVKNKLFAIIAHDLRGPLSSLQSMVYLVREHELSQEEMAEITKSLERNLQENASMMDNLLAWAQAQMNGIKLNLRKFNLIDGIKSVTDQIHFQAKKKGINIDLDIDPTIEVQADYDMVKLVVRNLVANAIKFSDKGDTIRLKAFYSKEKNMAEIHVKDEGIGMGIEDQKKLFSKDHFTKRGTDNEKGSGLGLMLCKDFIEGHGGSLRFESKPKKGTTFMITIPLAESSANSGNNVTALSKPAASQEKKPVLQGS